MSRQSSNKRNAALQASRQRIEDRLGLPFQAEDASQDFQLQKDFDRLKAADRLRFTAYPDWFDIGA